LYLLFSLLLKKAWLPHLQSIHQRQQKKGTTQCFSASSSSVLFPCCPTLVLIKPTLSP
jgi:hypothetical protein